MAIGCSLRTACPAAQIMGMLRRATYRFFKVRCCVYQDDMSILTVSMTMVRGNSEKRLHRIF